MGCRCSAAARDPDALSPRPAKRQKVEESSDANQVKSEHCHQAEEQSCSQDRIAKAPDAPSSVAPTVAESLTQVAVEGMGPSTAKSLDVSSDASITAQSAVDCPRFKDNRPVASPSQLPANALQDDSRWRRDTNTVMNDGGMTTTSGKSSSANAPQQMIAAEPASPSPRDRLFTAPQPHAPQMDVIPAVTEADSGITQVVKNPFPVLEGSAIAAVGRGSAKRRAHNSAPPRRQAQPRVVDTTGNVSSRAVTPSIVERTDGELWVGFLERAAAVVRETGVTDTAAAIFEAFRTSDNLALVFATFARLHRLATCSRAGTHDVPPWALRPQNGSDNHPWQFPYEALRVLLAGNWKAKQLWEKLDARCSRPEYTSLPCANKYFVVVGAGPCGLRAAIELRLLGASVTLIDKRKDFSRINQLHLWSWCGDELKALGARCLEPPSQDFGSNPDKLHIGIAELQILLLKTALLLGVEVLLGAEYLHMDWEGSWTVHLQPNGSFNSGAPSPVPPAQLSGVSALIGADGLGSNSVGRSVGVEAVEVGALRSEDAIGLVVNFSPIEGNPGKERSMRSFALAKQFYVPLFKEVLQATGAQLENIVYTKSKHSHYFVMTPTRKSLIDSNVIIDGSKIPLLAGSNINGAALDTLVRKVAAFRFKASEPTLNEVATECGQHELTYADNGPQLFDFSKLRRASEGLLFCHPPGNADESHDTDALLVALVGDALLEPFWPEGLGIVRGFLSALDASHAITKWVSGATCEATQQEFSKAYTQLKSLSSATRSSVLRPEESGYRLAPSTRYRYMSST